MFQSDKKKYEALMSTRKNHAKVKIIKKRFVQMLLSTIIYSNKQLKSAASYTFFFNFHRYFLLNIQITLLSVYFVLLLFQSLMQMFFQFYDCFYSIHFVYFSIIVVFCCYFFFFNLYTSFLHFVFVPDWIVLRDVMT